MRRGFLPRVIDAFGADFELLVDQHKRIFFEAAWEMGPENLRAILAQDLELREVYDSYRKLLDRNDSANAKKGFILALQLGLTCARAASIPKFSSNSMPSGNWPKS